MKKDENTPLPSLSDSDIVTVAKTRFESIVRSGKNVTVSLALATTGSMFMTGCADEKSCSDGDVTVYHYADPNDLNPADYTYQVSSADPSGNGDRCSDSD